MEHSHGFEGFNFAMDLVLVAISIWMVRIARTMSMGGAIGKTVNLVVGGAIVLGLAHLIETLLGAFGGLTVGQNELIHRFIILIGFVCLAIGMRSLGASIGKLKAPQKESKQPLTKSSR